MRIDLSVRQLSETGGQELAALRLAMVLHERGNSVRVLYGKGLPRSSGLSFVHTPALSDEASDGASRRQMEAALDPAVDVHITTCADPDLLRAAEARSPVITYAMEYSPICPAGSKYWTRVGAPCTIRAGALCAAARPVLGCGPLRQSLSRAPMQKQEVLSELLLGAGHWLWVPSTDMRQRFIREGFLPGRSAVVPNLGIRSTVDDLQRSAAETPLDLRDRILFVGRLAKEKGALLLERLARDEPLRSNMTAIGEGYLQPRVSRKLGAALRAPLSQSGISGALLWARGLLFPSVWPEPGGIVGLDAQTFGVPIAAFDVGAARDWPRAELLRPRDLDGLRAWAATLPTRDEPRDPAHVARSQQAYWSHVGGTAQLLLDRIVNGDAWPHEPENAVRDALGDVR